MNDNTVFEVKGLSKRFGDLLVLDKIDATIKKGEVVVIIGPSGSGKSTFLRSLNLLETPTDGEIIFEGTNITDKKLNINQYRQNIGMVFQHFNHFPNMTILKNMTIAPMKLKHMSKEEAELKRAIYEDSEDVLKDIAIREADIASSGDRIRAQVFKDVFDDKEDKKVVYCKYCGQVIDIDSVYCKHCGQKQ